MKQGIIVILMLLTAMVMCEDSQPAPAGTQPTDATPTDGQTAADKAAADQAAADKAAADKAAADKAAADKAAADKAAADKAAADKAAADKAAADKAADEVADKCMRLARGTDVPTLLSTCTEAAKNCGKDIKTLCHDTKVPIMRCMHHNHAKVSQGCKDWASKMMEERFAKKMPSCVADQKKLCPTAKHHERWRCMHQHHDKLSEACKKELRAARTARLGKCAADADKFCEKVRPGHGQIMRCLRMNRHKLSADCQEQMCGPIFGKCCTDIKKLCSQPQAKPVAKLTPGHKQGDDDEFEDSVKPVEGDKQNAKHWRNHRRGGKHHEKHGRPHHGRPHHGRPSGNLGMVRETPVQRFHRRHQAVLRCLAVNRLKLSQDCQAQMQKQDGHFELPGAAEVEDQDHEQRNDKVEPLPHGGHHHGNHGIGGLIGLIVFVVMLASFFFCCCRCMRRTCKRRCGSKSCSANTFPGQKYAQVPQSEGDVEMQHVAYATAVPVDQQAQASNLPMATAVPMTHYAPQAPAQAQLAPAHGQVQQHAPQQGQRAVPTVVAVPYNMTGAKAQPVIGEYHNVQLYAPGQQQVYRA